MRIHTDKLTRDDLLLTPGSTHLEDCSTHGSRKRARAFEVGLATYYGGKGTDHPYRRNTGKYGAGGGEIWAATYDEWGEYFGRLFDIDPDAIIGPYRGRENFHEVTNNRYLSVAS